MRCHHRIGQWFAVLAPAATINAMRRFLNPIKLAYNDAKGLMSCAILRSLEQRLPTQTLYRLLWSYNVARATFNELFKIPKSSRALPAWLQTSQSLRSRIRRRTEKYMNSFLEFFSDRLAEPRWRERCRLEGLEHLQAAHLAGRPVILAFFHFGPFNLSNRWLLALGFPAVAFSGGHSSRRSRLTRFLDRLSPFPDLPVFIYPDQLRLVPEFLTAGKFLFMAVDSPVGKQVTVPFGAGWTFSMTAGAARLAGRHGADLILCTITSEGGWRFRMKCSRPVPGAQLKQEADWQRASNFLMEQALVDFKACPEQVDVPRHWSPFKAEPAGSGSPAAPR
jgi:lauroyl/myristoyl acyltransferase